ncbi:MAG: F0F1 ATP synthase subunit epsilon [Parabacteroides sp.]|nr:F0F1 ATP synthase subunit epsilon [Parabacteroides sp.]
MELEIISPGGVLFKGETDYVSFPGTAGSFDVLPHHAPMIVALEEGVIRYQTDEKKEQEIKIQSGFVEIKDDILSVCIE